MFVRSIFIVSLMCLSADLCSAQPRFSKVTDLSAILKEKTQKVVVKWTGRSGARRYLINVFDSELNLILSERRKKTNLRIDPTIFTEDSSYLVKVKALKNNGFRASKFKKLKYKYTTKIPTAAIKARVQTINSGGRSGYYYLPKNYMLKKLPLIVAFHGSSIDGKLVVDVWESLLRKNEFIMIAPDSTNPSGWDVATLPGEVTIDYLHTLNVINEILSIKNINIDYSKVLSMGGSAGGSSAAYLGTSDPRFTHISVNHGGIDPNNLGDNKLPVWLSTGKEDVLRSPEHVKSFISILEELNFPSVTYNEYPYGHDIKKVERKDIIEWWIDTN